MSTTIYTSDEPMTKTSKLAGLRHKVASTTRSVAHKAVKPVVGVKHVAQGAVLVVGSKLDDHASIRAFHKAEKAEIVATGRVLRSVHPENKEEGEK